LRLHLVGERLDEQVVPSCSEVSDPCAARESSAVMIWRRLMSSASKLERMPGARLSRGSEVSPE
jgi:hypothetical protein